MSFDDLSSLKIEKSAAVTRMRGRRRRTYWLTAVVLIVLVLTVLYWTGVLSPSISVQVSRVTQIYPSQTFTTLNASGYVVAQRKSALASKITGRLIWLGGAEGSGGKAGEIIARLENQDVVAARDQARANVKTARWTSDQAKVELSDAPLALQRAKELIGKGYIAQVDYDTALTRYDKVEAGVRAAEATGRAREAPPKGAEGG